LVCVIVLLAILSVSAFLSWPGTSIHIGAEANQVANDLRYTQALAMAKGQRFYLQLSSTTTYRIVSNSGISVVNAMGGTTTTLMNGLSFGTLSNLPNSLLAFDSNGTPYIDTASPGTALAATASIPIVGGGKTATISITPVTGRVVVQ
ncbi:MAG TPA: GspH/FimT family pseudopilin, partial [Gammaproteobacteria bacterium]|nr:GspH/FimT family pseudopilin [Gammaproteobacteria bacterium]